MKFVKLFIASLLIFGGLANAQTVGKNLEFNSAWGVDYESNLIKNPSAYKNDQFTTVSAAVATRDTSAGNKVDNKASWLIDSTANGGYVDFATINPSDEQTSGQCGFRGVYKGDAQLYSAQIVDSSGNPINTVQLNNSGTMWQDFTIPVPCGASGARKPRFIQNIAGTSPAFNVGKLYYGRFRSTAGSVDQPLTNAGTITIGATTTAPTKGTATNDLVRQGRKGDQGIFRYEYKQTTCGSCAAGSGDYLFTLPNGLRFDSSKVTFYNTVIGGSATWPTPVILGSITVSDSLSTGIGSIIPYDATRFRVGFVRANASSGADRGIIGSSQFSVGGTASFSFDFTAPIEGWTDTAVITPNNTNWGPTSFGPITIGATTTAPTKASTKTIDDVTAYRQGRYIFVTYKYSQPNGTGAANGTGDYLVTIPGGYQADTALVTPYTGAVGSNVAAVGGPVSRLDTSGYFGGGGGARGDAIAFLYSSTQIRIQASSWYTNSIFWGSGQYNFTSSPLEFSFTVKIPIAGWNETQGAQQIPSSITSIGSQFSANLTAVMNTVCSSNGVCALTYSPDGLVITRTAAGTYTATAPSYIKNLVCDVKRITNSGYATDAASAVPLDNTYSFMMRTTGGALFDEAFHIKCTGTR